MNLFLSTPSARRATSIASAKPSAIAISIHALREEGDSTAGIMCRRPTNFYPRPPRGGRHKTGELALWDDEFLSTPSARRATLCRVYRGIRRDISIHALREEGDDELATDATGKAVFLSTPSARRATLVALRNLQALLLFLSTPSARRATN